MRSTTRSIRSQPTGSSSSSQPDTSQPAASNDEASRNSAPLTLQVQDNVTSSPESAAGAMRSVSQEFQTTQTSGPVPARVNRSAKQGNAAARLTLDIFGQHGSHSSASAALQSSLESRLRLAMDSVGSTACSLIWRDRITPAGRRILARRGLALRTSDRGSTLWHTPLTRDHKGYSTRDGESICNQLRKLYGGSGKPNPKWLAWLMGYEMEAWDACAGMAMRSSRNSPPSSSKQHSRGEP